MINAPKTKAEAEQYRYGQWSGNPKGFPYQPKQCAYEVCKGFLFSQCNRPNGHGPEGLYCKIHTKKL